MRTENQDDEHLTDKIKLLKNILTPLIEEGLVIAFSGGVDSGFLLWAGMESLKFIHANNKQGKLLALLTVSPSIPVWEIEAAKQFAASLNAELSVINSHEIQQEAYAKNDGARCYYCKSELFKIAKQEASQKGYRHIAYGYNATDRHDIRAGHKAATENNIHAPLDKAGLEKDDIRNALKEIGLDLAEKPASPCLASRIMTGVRVTEEKLGHIQKMESILRDAGLQIYRVRVHEEKTVHYFRIEVAVEEMMTVFKVRDALVHEAKKMGYRWVNLDLSGYCLGGGTLKS
jgi:uncharacterized protein